MFVYEKLFTFNECCHISRVGMSNLHTFTAGGTAVASFCTSACHALPLKCTHVTSISELTNVLNPLLVRAVIVRLCCGVKMKPKSPPQFEAESNDDNGGLRRVSPYSHKGENYRQKRSPCSLALRSLPPSPARARRPGPGYLLGCFS